MGYGEQGERSGCAAHPTHPASVTSLPLLHTRKPANAPPTSMKSSNTMICSGDKGSARATKRRTRAHLAPR